MPPLGPTLPVTAQAPAKAPGDSHQTSGALKRGWALQDVEESGKDTGAESLGGRYGFQLWNISGWKQQLLNVASKSLQVEWKEEGGVVGIGGPMLPAGA